MTQCLNYTAIAPAGVKVLCGVYGYILQCGLPASLAKLVSLRVSQITMGVPRGASSVWSAVARAQTMVTISP
jgi:hypothetical protein